MESLGLTMVRTVHRGRALHHQQQCSAEETQAATRSLPGAGPCESNHLGNSTLQLKEAQVRYTYYICNGQIVGQPRSEKCRKNVRRIWRVPNPPGANPLVAERAPWRSSQSRVTGGQQPIGNFYRFLSFLLHTCQPLCDPGGGRVQRGRSELGRLCSSSGKS